MDAESEYYQELRSLTKDQLLGEIRFLRNRIDEIDKHDREESYRIKEGRAAVESWREKKKLIRGGAAAVGFIIYVIGYSYYPGIINIMAFLFIIYLALERDEW